MKVKKFISSLLAAFIMMSFLSLNGMPAITGMADDGVMRDYMTAQDYADDMGLGINLGNTMESYDAANCTSLSYTWPPVVKNNTPRDYETCWGAVETTQKIIDGMKNAGFNTIRIPVFWGNMMANDGTYTISDAYINRVKEIVDYCRNAGVYTVINIHHFDEFIIRRNTKEKSAEIFKRIWTQIAEKFKDYSDYLMFEGFNEYLGGGQIDSNNEIKDLPESEGFDWTNKMNQAFVDAVRSTGGKNLKRMLIVSGYYTNVDKTTDPAFIMPKDTAKDRMMVSVHYVDGNAYWSNQIGGKFWQMYSLNQLNRLKTAFAKRGIPVFIGETTSIYGDELFDKNAIFKTTSEALDYLLRLIKGYGFIPVLWDVNDNFYSRTQCKIKSETDTEVIEKLAKELADGTFVPPETNYLDPMPKEDALGVVNSGNHLLNLASGTADASMAGAVKIKYIFDCAFDVSFNPWAGINLSATVAGKESKITVMGTNDFKGETAIEATLDLIGQINEGDSYSVYASTYSWDDARDYVYLIRCIKFIDKDGNVIKTIEKSNKPSEPPTKDEPNISDNSSNPSNQSGSGDQSKPTSTTPTAVPTTAVPKVTTPNPTFTKVVKPAKVKAIKLKAKKKKLNVSWKKVSGATGYEVKYAKNNKFTKGKKTVTVKKNKVTLKRLKSKKKYFVKVRAYKLASGRKYFGKWSKVVKKKVR